MKQIGDLPPANFVEAQAHHMLPWHMRDEFAAWGFDVNNPQFGKWVEASPHGNHQNWSRAYNADWRAFMDDLVGVDVQTGRASILNRLVELEAEFVPGGLYPIP